MITCTLAKSDNTQFDESGMNLVARELSDRQPREIGITYSSAKTECHPTLRKPHETYFLEREMAHSSVIAFS